MPVSPVATHDDVEPRAHLVVLGQHALGGGDEHPAAAVAVADQDLGDGRAGRAGGVVGAREQLELGRLRRRRSAGSRRAGARRRLRAERHDPGAAALRRATADAASAAASRPGLGEVRGVGEAGGLADHDPDARATLAARWRAPRPCVSSRHGRRGLPVLGEHLGQVAASGQRRGEDAFEDGGFDEGGGGHRTTGIRHRHRSRVGPGQPARRWSGAAQTSCGRRAGVATPRVTARGHRGPWDPAAARAPSHDPPMILPSIETPADLRAPERRPAERAGRRRSGRSSSTR